MISFLRAIGYFILHPFDAVHLTIVRRYVDAQGHFIGELYEGDGRTASMIGMSCDNLPLNIGTNPQGKLCWSKDFLAPMSDRTVRVGSMEPKDNESVRKHIAMKRFCPIRFTILNRFVEHIMESNNV